MAHAPRHTILLTQSTENVNTRCYYDFESRAKAWDGVLRIYEETLKMLHPTTPTFTYTVSDILTFLDSMGDVSCLVLDPASGKYEPHPRDYIKQQVYLHLKSIAERG